MSTIPASDLVNVTPSVLSAGGDALDIVGLMLTNGARVPIGSVLSFASASAVSTYFGASSTEAALAAIYFGGFSGANKVPASLLFAQYNQAAVAAFLRGGNVSALSLTQLQAINGTLIISVDGYTRTAAALNLSAATSFSSAAAIIQTALNASIPTQATVTGSISGTTLTVSAVSSGTLAVGQTITGSGISAGTIITALGTGTGGTGTYTVNNTQTAGSTTITATGTPVAVTYDSVSGGFQVASGITGAPSTIAFATGTTSTSLALTSAAGAVTSQGAAAASPSTFMDALVQVSTAWAAFMTTFDPDSGANTNKQAFALWNTGKGNKYGYVAWDTDALAPASAPATSTLGYILAHNNNSGTCVVWSDATVAAFVLGAAAAIDFAQSGGRITFAFKRQDVLVPAVTTETAAANLDANGYNFYGAYGSGSTTFTWFQRGRCTGPFAWFDSFVNQIWLNRRFQLALLNFLAAARSVPYSAAGNALIEQAMSGVISDALNFGAFAPGTISASQVQQVNAQAGADIAGALQSQGYYLQVLAADSATRAARQSPPCTFWYLDRGSVQQINLSSVAVQ